MTILTRTLFTAVTAAIVFSLSLPARARPAPPAQTAKDLTQLLESRYRKARSLRAVFLERYSENGRALRQESGDVFFRRPGKMRWEYAAPEKNLFVVDGKFAWFYVPADRTVSRVSAKQSDDWHTPLALLAGEMKVSRLCSSTVLAKSQPEDAALARLDCVVRGTEGEAKAGKPHDVAYFDINKTTGELASVVVAGAGGIRMEMNFSHWEFDPPLEEALFHFQAPRGVVIVNGEELLPGPAQTVR